MRTVILHEIYMEYNMSEKNAYIYIDITLDTTS